MLVLCTIPEVAVAVARDLGFDDLPDGDPASEAWIVATYRKERLRWRPMYYAEDPDCRQAVLDHLAELGSATTQELADLVGRRQQHLTRLANTRGRRGVERPPIIEWTEMTSTHGRTGRGAARG